MLRIPLPSLDDVFPSPQYSETHKLLRSLTTSPCALTRLSSSKQFCEIEYSWSYEYLPIACDILTSPTFVPSAINAASTFSFSASFKVWFFRFRCMKYLVNPTHLSTSSKISSSLASGIMPLKILLLNSIAFSGVAVPRGERCRLPLSIHRSSSKSILSDR